MNISKKWQANIRIFCGLFTLIHIIAYMILGSIGLYKCTVNYIDRTSLHGYTYKVQPGDNLYTISNMVADKDNGYSVKDAMNIYGNGHAIYHGALRAYDTMVVFTTKSRAAELGLTPADE